ncbi:hypothetical protein GDO81_007455 [Engystomops pustulosus]|uniref:Uncharacterized protein n=1 Tax=Engystomops pustulosus TaxID=76066 RepID=A0AAV7C980_ENGPU|nr:hypothetical protein GDO81_007455 [Engystomops pustulosus]
MGGYSPTQHSHTLLLVPRCHQHQYVWAQLNLPCTSTTQNKPEEDWCLLLRAADLTAWKLYGHVLHQQTHLWNRTSNHHCGLTSLLETFQTKVDQQLVFCTLQFNLWSGCLQHETSIKKSSCVSSFPTSDKNKFPYPIKNNLTSLSKKIPICVLKLSKKISLPYREVNFFKGDP